LEKFQKASSLEYLEKDIDPIRFSARMVSILIGEKIQVFRVFCIFKINGQSQMNSGPPFFQAACLILRDQDNSSFSKSVKPEFCTPLYALNHGRRNFKDTNPLMSSSLVILFGVVKQFGKF
jgi:hypothetical protein